MRIRSWPLGATVLMTVCMAGCQMPDRMKLAKLPGISRLTGNSQRSARPVTPRRLSPDAGSAVVRETPQPRRRTPNQPGSPVITQISPIAVETMRSQADHSFLPRGVPEFTNVAAVDVLPKAVTQRAATAALWPPAESSSAALARIDRILGTWRSTGGAPSPGSSEASLVEPEDRLAPSRGLVKLISNGDSDAEFRAQQISTQTLTPVGSPLPNNPGLPLPAVVAEPLVLQDTSETFPVDLPTVLRLAGGRNWSVQLAWERIQEAQANVTAAEAMWIPSLNVGLGATKHEGQIQATSGQVVDVSRNALFVGGGAKTGGAPLAGGAGGPARLAVDLSIADALFQPLVARQLNCAAQSRHAVEFNNAQRDGALAYFDLVAAQGSVAIGRRNLTDSEGLLAMTQAFVSAGKASPAEVSRVQVIVATQQHRLVDAEMRLQLASTELIRSVRLDASQFAVDTVLYSADDHLLPLELVPEDSDLESLISQGQRVRPEVAEQYAVSQARLASARSQELRPFIPNLNLGLSAGGFGGGKGSDIDNFAGRSDFDALLVWEVRNLGFGEAAARDSSSSRYRQAVLSAHQMQDTIAAEIRNAWHRVQAGRRKMDIAQENVARAAEVLELNLNRIRGLEGLPLEAVQALNAVSSTRIEFLSAIIGYNKAQAELLRAVGRPVTSGLPSMDPNPQS